jgi:hypothetical protein
MRLNKELTADEVAAEIDKTLAAADTNRADELDQLRVMREARTGGMEREAARLSERLGSDDPRVVALTNSIETNRALVGELTLEAERARTTVPGVDQKSWILHGYVRDRNLKGVPGVTVALYDRKAVWVQRLGYACTDAKGYFTLRASDIAGIDQPVFVHVLRNRSVIYADQTELKPQLGQVVAREIVLSHEGAVCAPPTDSYAPPSGPPIKPPDEPPSKGPATPPSPDLVAAADTWIVRGRVTDESGKGLQGLTVSVYDKDLIFHDRLGETTTDANGNFSVIYHTEDFRDVVERKPDIFLKVLNQKGSTLYSSKESVRYEAGRVEVFEIKIAADKLKQ